VRPSLPILLATGYAELPEGTQVEPAAIGKPYHQDQLRDRLDQLAGVIAFAGPTSHRRFPGLTCDQMVTYYLPMDAVFRALADPTRRSLLDELFREDGKTLSALEERLPMTRFGVMKHLKLWREAGLVVTKRRGRRETALLNPVPIRLVHDRWVSKYAEPWAAGLSDLKRTLEKTMEKVFEIYIKTTPERLWHAITDTEMRRKYNFGAVVTSDLDSGSRYEAWRRKPDFEGENLDGRSAAPAGAEFSRALGRGPVTGEGTSRVTLGRSNRSAIHAG